MVLRTTDTSYGQEYWATLDSGAGYQDSTMWADIGHAIAEVLVFDKEAGVDRSGEHCLVDVGCAYGFLLRHLRKRGIESFGLDFSQYAISQAPDDVSYYIKRFDLTKPDLPYFRGKQFTLLTCIETLEHIPEDSTDTALTHLYRMLKPGGLALLTICVAEQPDTDSDPTHVTIKPRDWWLNRISNAGFNHRTDLEKEFRYFWLFSQHKGIFVVQR